MANRSQQPQFLQYRASRLCQSVVLMFCSSAAKPDEAKPTLLTQSEYAAVKAHVIVEVQRRKSAVKLLLMTARVHCVHSSFTADKPNLMLSVLTSKQHECVR